MATNQMGLASKAKLTAIANAIRSKLGVSTQYSLDDMPTAIASISGGGGINPSGTKQISITQNGTTTEDVTNYASAEITVNVPSGGITPTGTIQITENGTFDVTQYASAAVNVPSGGGGGKTLTKLGEYVITAPVSYVAITATDAMKSCDWLYIKYNNVVLSASDWIYPYINGSPGSGSHTMGYDGGTTYNFTRILTALPTFSGESKMFFFDTANVQKLRYASELNQINFRLYGSAVTFNSGSFEIWGYV